MVKERMYVVVDAEENVRGIDAIEGQGREGKNGRRSTERRKR